MLDQDIVIPVAVQYAFSYPPGSLNDLLIIEQISWGRVLFKVLNRNQFKWCSCVYLH